jgi:hypothetical protein
MTRAKTAEVAGRTLMTRRTGPLRRSAARVRKTTMRCDAEEDEEAAPGAR